jgi:ABC-type lipoprotein release transport system permease subunit
MGVLGVFLTLALLTAVHLGLESISLSYLDLASLQAGKADILVRREGFEWTRPAAFDPSAVTPGGGVVKGFAPRLLGVRPVGDRFALIVGIDPDRERELGIEGFTPRPALAKSTVALSENLGRALGKGPVDLDGRPYEVVGTVERQQVFPQHLKDFVVADLATAREILGEPQGVHVLAGALADPRSCYDARDLRGSVKRLKDAGETLAEGLGPEYAVALPKAQAITAFEQAAGPLRAVFGIFAAVALAITALLVYSLVSVSVEERVREHAILRLVGAKRRHLAALVLGESALLCLLGVAPGVAAGAVLARGLLAIVGLAMGAGAGAVPLELSGATARFCLAAGVLVCAASSLGPAIRASRRRILDALDPLRRGQVPEESPEGAAPRWLLWIGAGLSAVSGTVFFVLPSALLSGDPALIGSVALGLLAAIVVGFTLIAAAAAPFLERTVLAVLAPVFGPAADLAARNLAGHRRRSVTTSLMFALSVSFVVFLASLASLFSRTSLGVIERRIGGDLRLAHADPKEPDLLEEIAAVPGVEKTAMLARLRGRTAEGIAYDVVASDLVGMKHLWMIPVGADPSYAEVVDPRRVEFTEGDASAFRALADDEGDGTAPPAIASLSLARFLDVGKGDLVSLSYRLGAQREDARVRIVAVVPSLPGHDGLFRARVANAQGSGLLLSRKAFDRMTRAAPREAFEGTALLKARGEAARALRERLGLRFGLGVESAEEEKREAANLYWATQALFSLLMAAATAIAFFGLVAAMATAALERRREIGILKAVGLRRSALQRMFAAESTALTLSSGLLGGAMGFLLAWLFIVQAAALMEVPAAFAPPWITFAATVAVCFAAGRVAAWAPTRSLLKRPVAEILRS